MILNIVKIVLQYKTQKGCLKFWIKFFDTEGTSKICTDYNILLCQQADTPYGVLIKHTTI